MKLEGEEERTKLEWNKTLSEMKWGMELCERELENKLRQLGKM